MVNKSRLTAWIGNIGIDAFESILRVYLGQPERGKTEIPSIQTVPPLAGCKMPDVTILGVNGIDYVRKKSGFQFFLAEGIGHSTCRYSRSKGISRSRRYLV